MTRALAVLALLSSVVAAPASAQQPAPAAPKKIQVLIISGQQVAHNWKGTTPLLRKALEDTGKFEVRVTEEFRGGGPETLAPYDLVVLNYSGGNRPELRWGDRADAALLDFVRSGKGLVVYHFTMQSFEGWTEFEKLSGANWRPNFGHHSAPHDFTITVKDAQHPITKGLKLKFDQQKDELYANLKWQPAGPYKILATAYDDHALYAASRTDARAPQPLEGPGADEPMLWVSDYGKGRVFTTALGHDVDQVQTLAFTTTFARGAEWAATGNVTLPIPPALAANPQAAATPQAAAAQAPLPEGYVARGTRVGQASAPGMKVTDLGTAGRTYRINLTKGDEVMTALVQFAEKNNIKNAHFTGVGALSKGLFSWADTDRGNAMKKIELNQEAEMVSLVGSIERDNQGRPNVHAHGSVAYSDGTIHGGHWWEAYVGIIAEIFVTEENPPAGTAD
jgi:predicted DNA-binding protein with PD1-like motif/type 1 glutamine amidotransferase